MSRRGIAAAVLALMVAAGPLHAGQTCTPMSPSVTTVQRSLELRDDRGPTGEVVLERSGRIVARVRPADGSAGDPALVLEGSLAG